MPCMTCQVASAAPYRYLWHAAVTPLTQGCWCIFSMRRPAAAYGIASQSCFPAQTLMRLRPRLSLIYCILAIDKAIGPPRLCGI